jgi:hypothetical protein
MTYQVKNRFQSLPFKCKPAALHSGIIPPIGGTIDLSPILAFTVVGLCTLNQVDP